MEEKYGEVEEMNVCDNLGDHLVGNVYVKVGVVSSVLMHQQAPDVKFYIMKLNSYHNLSWVVIPLHIT